jgi:hypothetical protein
MLTHDLDQQQGLLKTTTEGSAAPVAIPVIEESLIVEKRIVDNGGYRMVKTVSVREEWVDEPLIPRRNI